VFSSDIPTIVTTDFEGNLSTSIPRSPALAQKPLSDHLHASMPDISETSTEIQTESKLKEVPEISAEMVHFPNKMHHFIIFPICLTTSNF